MAPAGFFETASDRIRLRLSGDLQSVDSVRNTPIMAQRAQLSARRHRPRAARFHRAGGAGMRVQGKKPVGIAVAMNKAVT